MEESFHGVAVKKNTLCTISGRKSQEATGGCQPAGDGSLQTHKKLNYKVEALVLE